jgi:prevent-host-death family protein
LTEFQRNARSFIDGLNETKEPVLLTVNGKVQAVLVDPASYQQLEAQVERQRFLGALAEGERAIQEGRVRPAEQAYLDMKSKYDF